ncbi:hypothetical protein L2E69_07040 [Planktothrix agardhii 1806]|uniref:Uncharacterized protein n=2 Tax=Planktothrix agardhii TaxID=1160 RepID=A0AAD1PZA6_PLAAG|nr:hypothetical protein [Planktothrix agardhii]MCB8786082.1 hypothetical protein [Planktothrix agardhii 1025]MCF3603393.1 hypothetical protein [Planktothrix agardhii 1804]MCF3615700.1 hypothetical protein [Planktothrix agardhii 1806]MCF3613982.1 hypothetical protein [Planktothrix agardhii 1027]CAD5911641.1 hypothetical protein PANO66_00081 [Planktothrix agardhii]
MLRQSDVARMLGVSHQRVSQLRLRHRIEFTWNRNLKTWVTTIAEVEYSLACRTERSTIIKS